MKMKDCASTTWSKLFEIATKSRTLRGKINAIRAYTDFFDDMSDEELEHLINSEWCTICDDGIIVWQD